MGHAAARLVSLAAILGLWVAASALTGDSGVLPAPRTLWEPLSREIASGELPFHLSKTLVRVAWSFVLAMAAAIVLGTLMGTNPKLDRWLDP